MSESGGSHKIFTKMFSILFVLLVVFTVWMILTRNAAFNKMYFTFFAKSSALMINALVSSNNNMDVDFYDLDGKAFIFQNNVTAKENFAEVFSPITKFYPFGNDIYTKKIIFGGENLHFYKGDNILLYNSSKEIKYEFDCPFIEVDFNNPKVIINADDELYDFATAMNLNAVKFTHEIARARGEDLVDAERLKNMRGDVALTFNHINSIENYVLAKIKGNDIVDSYIACKVLNMFELPTVVIISDEDILYSANHSIIFEIYGNVPYDKKVFAETMEDVING